jgi:16S rRNA (cytidine1402-2'-O)-methyltransferase
VGTLYLVSTPIGNLEDITQRALRVLGEVELIAAEDTRHSRKLLTHYQIRTPLESYHEHSKPDRLERLLDALDSGDVALIADAGTPLLSDPGHALVRAALARGHSICPIPGASAPLAALVASGLPTDAFVFIGFLPRRSAERRETLERLISERRTIVAFETPHRLRAALEDLGSVLGAARAAVVCRELTKQHEEFVRGTLASLRTHFNQVEPRGEITLVIAGVTEAPIWDEQEVRAAIRAHLAQGAPPSQAAREVAAESGWARREVYRLVLEE